jgi:uncharacterized protein (DUF2235 family)
MRLVIFADGTWNKIERDGSGTNVVKLYRLALHDSANGQHTFYDAGVGNSGFDKIRGGLFGLGLSQNVIDCYKFLLRQWTASAGPHDIFLFGFSRGAYTVRSLAGLLGRIGLVKHEDQIKPAYEHYRLAMSKDKKHIDARERFVAAHVHARPRIKMIGVWDTVGALGIPVSWMNKLFNPVRENFHDTGLGAHIDAAYHAVSVDEERVAYAPTLWDPIPENSGQLLEQVYFPGVHSDVGGGYKDDSRLGEVTLRWMGDRAVARGLALKPESKLPDIDATHCHGLIHEPMKWLPIRRDRRKIPRQSSISQKLEDRRKAPRGAFVPHPYAPRNVLADGEYRFVP